MYQSLLNIAPAQRALLKEAILAPQPQKKPLWKNPWVMGGLGAAALGAGAYGMMGNPKADFQGLLDKGRNLFSKPQSAQSPAYAPMTSPEPISAPPMTMDQGFGKALNDTNNFTMGIGNGTVTPTTPAVPTDYGRLNDALSSHSSEMARLNSQDLPNWLQNARTFGAVGLGGSAIANAIKPSSFGKALGPAGALLDVPAGMNLGNLAADGYGIENPTGRKAMQYLGAADLSALNLYALGRSGGLGGLAKVPSLASRLGFGGVNMIGLPTLSNMSDRFMDERKNQVNANLNSNVQSTLNDSYFDALNREKWQGDSNAVGSWVKDNRGLIPPMLESMTRGQRGAEANNNESGIGKWLHDAFMGERTTTHSPAAIDQLKGVLKQYAPDLLPQPAPKPITPPEPFTNHMMIGY